MLDLNVPIGIEIQRMANIPRVIDRLETNISFAPDASVQDLIRGDRGWVVVRAASTSMAAPAPRIASTNSVPCPLG